MTVEELSAKVDTLTERINELQNVIESMIPRAAFTEYSTIIDVNQQNMQSKIDSLTTRVSNLENA